MPPRTSPGRLNARRCAVLLTTAKGSKAKQRALGEFVKGFKARWQPQTVCVAAYTVADCGPTQEPPL